MTDAVPTDVTVDPESEALGEGERRDGDEDMMSTNFLSALARLNHREFKACFSIPSNVVAAPDVNSTSGLRSPKHQTRRQP